MNVFEASYLLRYLLGVIVVLVAVRLLIVAIRELRWAMRHSLRPAQGYFLLNNQGDGQTLTLPLYHTTNVGRSNANDIRIHSNEVQRKHAIIYRFDGDWYVRPQNMQAEVLINEEKIHGQRRLENQDKLSFGPSNFLFVNERTIAQDRGEAYEEAIFDDNAFLKAVKQNSTPLYLEWFLVNVFTFICLVLLVFMMPEEMGLRKEFFLWTMVPLVLMNLYFLLLPKIAKYGDRVLFLATMQLAVIGMAIQGRLDFVGSNALRRAIEAEEPLRILEISTRLFNAYRTQMIALIIGLFFVWIILLISSRTRFLESITVIAGVVTPLLLIVTLILGSGMETFGANLWIQVGGFSLQLTEFAKITYLITLASFFKNRPPLRVQLFFAGWAAFVFFLLLLLPDLGSIMILLPVTLLVFVVMTSEYVKTLLIFLSASFMSVFAYLVFPHVRARISGWTSIWSEVNDSNRQVVYGLQALGRGQVFGRGLGNGSPGGIPLADSDMVFTILAEEFGILLAISVLIILFVVVLRSLRTTVLARDGFSSSLALGLGSAIFLEAFVVIAGTTGLLPLTGVTLPFIASGGSSMIAKWFMIAILLGLAARQEEGASRK